MKDDLPGVELIFEKAKDYFVGNIKVMHCLFCHVR